jgi:hypothetical protein
MLRVDLTSCRLWVCAGLAGIAAAATGGVGHAWHQARVAENRVDYDIRARLEGETKVLTGRETIAWTNGGPDAVGDAWFHLYLNAFSNNRSTHLVEAKGELRDHAVEDGWGWSRVTAIRALDPGGGEPVNLMPSFRYRHPDEADEAGAGGARAAEDRTVFSVELPRAVAPGETLRLEVEWESQLPRVRRRTGYKDDFLLVAQWFPKLGVYEAGRGWNCHQFHMSTEFYSDYGYYDVQLDLPTKYHQLVFGSGGGSSSIMDGRTIAEFHAPALNNRTRVDAFGELPVVHDFTWTASPRYVATTRSFEPASWIERYPDEVARVVAAVGPEATNIRRVDVITLLHPEHFGQDQEERHRHATYAALFFYGLWFGEYPYQRLTVVDPPHGAGGAGGMEYPTLFTAGSRLFTSPEMHSPEGVTVHEAGHQFWYGLVGNNEFEAAWLDEGFNSYADSEVLALVYGPERAATRYAGLPVWGVPVASLEPRGRLGDLLGLRKIPAPLGIPIKPLATSAFLERWRDQPALTFVEQRTDPRWGDRSGYLRDPDTDPIDTAAFEYADRASYRANSYPRTAVALRTLQHVVGDAPFLRGMRRYAKEWRYRHPYPDDFFRSFQAGAGVDCQWYFDEVFRTTEIGDWQLEVSQRKRPEDRGLFQGEGGEFLERSLPDDDAVEAPWQVEVLLRRDGGLSIPIDVRLTFDDGTTRDDTWTREEQLARAWKRLAFESETKLVSAQLDPEKGIFLDANCSNDAWYDRRDRVAPWRWGERVLAEVQHGLCFLAGIGG